MTTPAKPLDWSEAVRERDSAERARFLESHVDLVKYLALRLSTRLPASVEVDDLINDGILGLLDAAEKFNPVRGVRFRTYAEARVRGAILDGLRQKDWRPRSLRHMRRQLDEVVAELSTKYGRPATDEEIARAMSMDLDSYRTALKEMSKGALLSLEELAGGMDPAVTGESEQPNAPLERKELLQALADELQELPDRERQVLELYYHEGLNMKEVGGVLGVTESRVCQLHSQAAARLRVALKQRLHVTPVPAGGR